jgi:hypothetical protein
VDIKLDIESTQAEIKRLQEKLANLQQWYATSEKALEEENLYLLNNKNIVTEYENSTSLVKEATEYKAKKQEFYSMLVNLEEYNKVSDEAINLDGKLTELRKLKAKFNAEAIPDIPGLAVYTPDEEETREGAFFKDMPIGMLCESEQWEWYVPFAKACKIRVMYIENITNLGSGSIKQFNEFIEQGGYVFASRMDVEQKNLRITFNTKIPTYKSTVKAEDNE